MHAYLSGQLEHVEVPGEVRHGEHGVARAHGQQPRVGSLHFARELIVFAGVRADADNAFAYEIRKTTVK